MKVYKSKLKLVIILIIVAALFIGLNFSGLNQKIKNFFYLSSFPFQRILWGAGNRISDFFETIYQIKYLKNENTKLKLKIKEILAENVKLLELKKENEILRQALEIGLQKEFKLMLAEVIGRDISDDSLIINRGSKHGVKSNQTVITQQKILVGKINQVYQDFSKVMLISNKESSFDAKIANSEIFGIIRGKGNFKIVFDLIAKEKEIKKGDLVISAALGGIFPEGLLVGEISEVKKIDIEPWQSAQLEPAFDIGELEKILIITDW